MAAIPQFVCLKSVKNNKFLRYKNDFTETRGLLQFAGTHVMDPYAQFEVVEAKNGGGLVHLKSRYTNLYLVRWSQSKFWISALAFKPEEDDKNWACTLFKPIVVDGPGNTKRIRLLHVQLKRYVRLQNGNVSDPYVSCLLADSNQPDNQNFFDSLIVVDWESFFKLPKNVAFKSVETGLYLGPKLFNGEPALQFSFKDAKDPKVAHEIFTFPNGTIYVKSKYYGKFWRVLEDVNKWIVVDADGPNTNTNNDAVTLRVHPTDVNVVALLSMTHTSFLKRLTIHELGWVDSIAVATQTIDTWAFLEVVDLDKLIKN